MVAGGVSGVGLPAADRPALLLELGDHVEHPRGEAAAAQQPQRPWPDRPATPRCT